MLNSKTLRFSLLACALAGTAIAANAPPGEFPKEIQLPPLESLVPPCADPAADHFIEIDISQRPPEGSTRVQRLSGWVTPDGIFHWPFVMRMRNIGDQPFLAKPGQQFVTITLDDLTTGKRNQTLAKIPFDRVAAHSGMAARFEFSAPLEQAQKGRFHRIYTLAVKYEHMDAAIINGRNGDCNLRNNLFAIEFDGSRKNWIFAR